MSSTPSSEQLPGGYGKEMVSTDAPPPLIPASTVILLRDTPHGVKILMLKRNSKGAFGGFWVFPGGRVDDTDADELAAAVREAKEESGIDLDPTSFVRFSHWTPPATEMKRFSTWFFIATAPGAEDDVAIDEGEIVDHAWVTAAEMLAKRDAGEIELAPPTFVTLSALKGFTSTDAALAASRNTEAPVYLTQLAKHEKRVFTLWEGDVAYDNPASIVADGPRHRLELTAQPWEYQHSL